MAFVLDRGPGYLKKLFKVRTDTLRCPEMMKSREKERERKSKREKAIEICRARGERVDCIGH